MKEFTGADELVAAAGQELGISRWETLDQARIDEFAAVTGDHQLIHVDPDRTGYMTGVVLEVSGGRGM